jgi:hypothetical protein
MLGVFPGMQPLRLHLRGHRALRRPILSHRHSPVRRPIVLPELVLARTFSRQNLVLPKNCLANAKPTNKPPKTRPDRRLPHVAQHDIMVA